MPAAIILADFMLPTPFIKILLTLLVLSIIGGDAPGQTAETGNQGLPGVRVSVDLNPKVRLQLFAGRENSEEKSNTQWKTNIGVSYRVKPLIRGLRSENDSDNRHLLVVGGGYEYLRTNNNGTIKNEHRIMANATPRYSPGAGFLIEDRNLVEFRWINGKYDFRYRNRLMIARGFKIKKFKFKPYASGEMFWDRNAKSWNQNQLSGGLQIPLRRYIMFDVFYQRKNCTSCSQAHTNGYGLTLNLFFKKKI